jgi:hypothetical protein
VCGLRRRMLPDAAGPDGWEEVGEWIRLCCEQLSVRGRIALHGSLPDRLERTDGSRTQYVWGC